jgi:hypothetical protein
MKLSVLGEMHVLWDPILYGKKVIIESFCIIELSLCATP